MSWTCSCDTQNLDRVRYCEFCGAERRPTTGPRGSSTGSGLAWSPPTPTFTDEPWSGHTRMTPEGVEPFLAELKKYAATSADERGVTPERLSRYLTACRQAGFKGAEVLEALGEIKEPEPRPPSNRPRRHGRSLAALFPTTEAEARLAAKFRGEVSP